MPDLVSLVDQSLLKPETKPEEVSAAIKEAQNYHYNSICIRPHFIAEFSKQYRLSAVIGFPVDFISCEVTNGVISNSHDLKRARDIISAPSMAAKVVEARNALEAGALELDPVININDLFSPEDFNIVYPVFSQEQDLKKFADAIVPETKLNFPGDKLRKELQIYLFLLREFASQASETNSSLRAEDEAIHDHRHCERSEAIHYYSLKPIFSCELLTETELELSISIFAEEVLNFYEQFPETIGRIRCSYKNSTGFIKSHDGSAIKLATPELISRIATELNKHDPDHIIGIKAAGGVRDLSSAEAVAKAAAGRLTHIGTSAGANLASDSNTQVSQSY